MTKASELILNDDNSVYHLHLQPDQIAGTVITVGDPERVKRIVSHFDEIEHKARNREFYTVTGFYNNNRISVISTGIGPDNIDIVFNELDILKRFHLPSGKFRTDFTPYTFIRLGTTGTAQEDIPVGSFVVSEYAVGMDNLLQYYNYEEPEVPFAEALKQHLRENLSKKFFPLITAGAPSLIEEIGSEFRKGITATCPGFYAPQGRSVSLEARFPDFLEIISVFRYKNHCITNFEMETNAIYGLSSMLGHRAISCSAVLANRATGKFSSTPGKDVDRLIEAGLQLIDGLS